MEEPFIYNSCKRRVYTWKIINMIQTIDEWHVNNPNAVYLTRKSLYFIWVKKKSDNLAGPI